MLIGGGVGFPVMVAHLTKFIMMGMRKRSFENDHRPFSGGKRKFSLSLSLTHSLTHSLTFNDFFLFNEELPLMFWAVFLLPFRLANRFNSVLFLISCLQCSLLTASLLWFLRWLS